MSGQSVDTCTGKHVICFRRLLTPKRKVTMQTEESESLRAERREGFQSLNTKVDSGFADMHRALHGLMFKLLTASDINEIRSQMKNPPEMRTFPFWAIR